MISPPPSFYDIKNGFKSSFDYIRRKDKIDNLFELNNEKFWHSCWIVFFVNALVAVLASYGIKASFDISMKANLLPKLILITIIDISLFAILVFHIFKSLNKEDLFLKFIIPFNWIQGFQAFIMLSFTFFGLFLPASIFLFFGFALIIIVTFALWRLGKEEIGFSGWGAAGLIILSVLSEAGIGLISRSLSNFFM
tara:strand:- start:97 stop:681 length:585 start_codon:yes stop_codon:yes gene_type:complete